MHPLLRRLLPDPALAQARRWRDAHVYTLVTTAHDAGTAPRAFCLFGREEWSEHLGRVYLESGGAPVSRRRVNTRGFVAAATALAQRHGLVLIDGIDVSAVLERRSLRLPRLVALSVDVGESAAAFHARVRTETKREINRAEGFDWDVCRDPAWCAEFHERHHREAITARHGREAFLMGLRDMVDAVACQGWEFVRIFENGRCVAATLGQPDSAGYYLRRAGWLDGDPELLQRGALAACYWYAFERARQLGLRKVRLGGTPPYLEDGLFQYKMKWRSSLDSADTRFGEARLLLHPSHPDVVAFLRRKSLVTLDDCNRFVVFSARRAHELNLTDELLGSLHAWKRLDAASGRFVDEPLTPRAKTPRPAPAA